VPKSPQSTATLLSPTAPAIGGGPEPAGPGTRPRATAIDVLRFVVRVDGFAAKPDMLTAADITQIATGSGPNPNYGMGWVLDPPNARRWHNGNLWGTNSFMSRQNDGFSVYAVINSTEGPTPNLDVMLKTILTSISSWPSYDLFTGPL